MKQKAVLGIVPAEWNVGDVYQVHLIKVDEKIKETDYGIVFIVNNFDNVLPRDSSKIMFRWLPDDTLKIIYDKSLKIHKQVIKTRDNVIVYEALDSVGKIPDKLSLP